MSSDDQDSMMANAVLRYLEIRAYLLRSCEWHYQRRLRTLALSCEVDREAWFEGIRIYIKMAQSHAIKADRRLKS